MANTRLIDQLCTHEGLRLTPYRCTAGKLTIGYGRNLDDQGITQQEAQALLVGDIARVRAELSGWFPWWRQLDGVRQDVLVNMAFNLGIMGLLQFEKTLAAVREGRYDEAAHHMLRSLWAKQVKGRATELAAQMRTGEYVK